MEQAILAGDIGGTKTILGTAYLKDRTIFWTHKRRFESSKYSSLDEIIADFFSEVSLIPTNMVAALGIAGPVNNGKVETTNLPWHIDASKLKAKLGLKEIILINDFTAIGHGIPHLKQDDLQTLNLGCRNSSGPIAIIGAGTGLGQGLALYCESEKKYIVLASEGGHCNFSPTNDEEIGLLKYLMEKYEHVSIEKILSGHGLVNIYDYLIQSGFAERSFETTKKMEEGNPSAIISSLALNGKDENCIKAIDMFVSIYGAEAGNLALKILPSGGLYIGGGMAPKMLDKITDGTFIKALLNKGRLSQFLKNIPVNIILNDEVGLIGAAARGSEINHS